MKTDNGLRTAMKKQSATRQLPSNFGYRTMQRIDENLLRREKRNERAQFICLVAFCALSVAGSIVYLLMRDSDLLSESVNDLLRYCSTAPHLLFWIPSLVALLLLLPFEQWLKRKILS